MGRRAGGLAGRPADVACGRTISLPLRPERLAGRRLCSSHNWRRPGGRRANYCIGGPLLFLLLVAAAADMDRPATKSGRAGERTRQRVARREPSEWPSEKFLHDFCSEHLPLALPSSGGRRFPVAAAAAGTSSASSARATTVLAAGKIVIGHLFCWAPSEPLLARKLAKASRADVASRRSQQPTVCAAAAAAAKAAL